MNEGKFMDELIGFQKSNAARNMTPEERHELEHHMMIDLRLGKDFDPAKRQRLMRIFDRMTAKHNKLLQEAGPNPSPLLAENISALVCEMHQEVANVLNPEECEAFLGLEPGTE